MGIISPVIADGFSLGDNYSTFTPTNGLLEGATTELLQNFGIIVNPISVKISSVSTDDNGDVITSSISPNENHLITQIGDGQIQAIATISSECTNLNNDKFPATTLITKTNSPSTESTSTSDTFIQADKNVTVDTNVLVVTVTSVFKSYVIVKPSLPETSSNEDTTTYTVTPTVTDITTKTSLMLPTLDPTTVIIEERDILSDSLIEKRELPTLCSSETALSLTLQNSILTDSKGRIGSIVSSRQFQFDGPPPQTGTIFAAGWSIVDGKLALGNSTTFFQCLSGDFYNIYDTSIAEQCNAVELDVVIFDNCQ